MLCPLRPFIMYSTGSLRGCVACDGTGTGMTFLAHSLLRDTFVQRTKLQAEVQYLDYQIKSALQKFGQVGGSLRASRERRVSVYEEAPGFLRGPRSLRAGTRPRLNLSLPLRTYGQAVTLKVPGKSRGHQGLTLVHFSAQLKRFLRDRSYI